MGTWVGINGLPRVAEEKQRSTSSHWIFRVFYSFGARRKNDKVE